MFINYFEFIVGYIFYLKRQQTNLNLSTLTEKSRFATLACNLSVIATQILSVLTLLQTFKIFTQISNSNIFTLFELKLDQIMFKFL